MSEYYDNYHRWEPLAEFNFCIDDTKDLYENDDNYIYCLCSRVFIRDGVKYYYVEKEEASESDIDVQHDSLSQDWEDQSHVHFSIDTSYKVKCEKDEGASCYCSASHTDNYWSTDEHDPAQLHGSSSHALQPSDSGADLTYPDCQSDKLEKMDQDYPTKIDIEEDYLTEKTWEKFWSINGERIIWASWIKKYSDYINPAYLDENNDIYMDENNIPKQHSADPIFTKYENIEKEEKDKVRERKFSYDSKINPYKKNNASHNVTEKPDKGIEFNCNKDDTWLSIGRRRSCSEHDRMVSPRTLAGTDSMTNVTKLTFSSYDATSSHVTSDSTPTDDYSVSSTTSEEQSNDQTRIANIHESIEQVSIDELDTEQYWQLLWKKHFGEQYALHLENYTESHNKQKTVTIENNELHTESKRNDEKLLDIECELSEGNSQEMPTIIEVQSQVNQIKLNENEAKPKNKKRNKTQNNKYLSSVGVLLQNLLKEEQKKNDLNEVNEAGEGEKDNVKAEEIDTVDGAASKTNHINEQQSTSNSSFNPYNNDGDDDPPEKRQINLKRSHEIDDERESEKIKSTLGIMGFHLQLDNIPKGEMVYRKRLARLRPPRNKRFGSPRKTYFDDDGNAIQPLESQDENDVPSDEGCMESIRDKTYNNDLGVNEHSNAETDRDITLEASATPFPTDINDSFSDGVENEIEQDIEKKIDKETAQTEITKRKRRTKRARHDISTENISESELPAELRGDPKMLKYWKKRHSLFQRFDEGILLDRESWFSVTPENVARHIANKFSYDVVIDGFCGAGGNTIQFAKICKKVIAIDIDPAKIELAKHNANVYGVLDRIEFVVGDFFELATELKADMVFLSPPWGGPNYIRVQQYDIEVMLEPQPASELMKTARQISTNITLYLPRNSKMDQILSLAKGVSGSVEVEQSYLDRRFVAITAYYY